MSPVYSEGGRVFPPHSAFEELHEYLRQEFRPEWCDSDDAKGHEEAGRYETQAEFFRTTTLFAYQSIGLTVQGVQRPYVSKVVASAADKGAVTLLDVGSGGGQLALAFHELGFRVSLADVWSRSLFFAKWRFTRRGVDVPAYVLDANPPPDVPPHQVVTCFDVLEHLTVEKQLELLSWMGERGELVFANLIIDDAHEGLHFPVDVDALRDHVSETWSHELTAHYPDAAGNPRQYLLVYGSGVHFS